MRRRLLGSCVLGFCLLFSFPVWANQVVGRTYETDIQTFVNGAPIAGYNMGGKTLVLAEDLLDYGFSCWISVKGEGILEIASTGYGPSQDVEQGAKLPLGPVEVADDPISFHGVPVTKYLLQGQTAVCLEELGEVAGSKNEAYGYSDYLAKTTWDGAKRTLSFDTFLSQTEVLQGVEATRLDYTFLDDTLYFWPNDLRYRMALLPSDGSAPQPSQGEGTQSYAFSAAYPKENQGTIQPLYVSTGEGKEVVGQTVTLPATPWRSALTYLSIVETESVAAQMQKVRTPQKSYAEAYDFFTKTYQLESQIENETHTVCVLREENGGPFVVVFAKDGGYVVLEDQRDNREKTITVAWNGENAVDIKMYPFAAPHGITTTMVTNWNVAALNFR